MALTEFLFGRGILFGLRMTLVLILLPNIPIRQVIILWQQQRHKQIYNSRFLLMARKQQQRSGIFNAVVADGCASNNGTATEEWCFLCSPCRCVIRRTSEE
jgi:hypothetical protein